MQPAPSQNTHVIANSTEGSVNGKNDGLKRALMSGPKSDVDERLDGAEQIAERDAAVDREPLDLVEHGRVPGVERVAAVGTPRRHHVDGRALRFHRAHLHRRGVRAQHHLFGPAQLHVERVLHGAGRVAGREVERLEVEPVGLDLGPLGHLVAHAHEHVFELAPDPGDRVQVPAAVAAASGREVEAVVHERCGARVGRERDASLRDFCFERGARRGDGLAGRGPLRRRRRP